MSMQDRPETHADANRRADREIVEAVLRGDANRFEALLRRHNALVFRTARGVLRDDVEAEECAQRAWILAFERLGQFGGAGAFPAWVGRITFREALRMLRTRRRSRLVPLPPGSQASLFEDDERMDPVQETELQRAQARAELEAAIDALPGVLREVLVLRDVQELPAEEVATILGITEVNVRVRLHRARQAMRGRMVASDIALPAAFAFAGERCDRIVARVLAAVKPRRDRTPYGQDW